MSYQLYHGDCLDVLPLLPDSSVDAIIADWPYGTTACKWDSIIPLEPLWAECKRVIKRNGAIVLFGSQPFTSMLVMSNLEMFKYALVWENTKATGFLNVNFQPLKAHQDICVFSMAASTYSKNRTMTYNPQIETGPAYTDKRTRRPDTDFVFHASPYKKIATLNKTTRFPRSIMRIPFNQGLHPTQKPLALLEYLVKTYTNPGDTVLDNTFGSCTTGEACLRTGRRFIGIERDDAYFRIGQERLERVTMELKSMLPLFQEAVI